MILRIKNMVCRRCKIAVQAELAKLGLSVVSCELGSVEIRETNIDSVRKDLINRLRKVGLDLIEDKNHQAVEKIKTLIIELVHEKNAQLKTTLSDYLSRHMLHEYSGLSQLFSSLEGQTIERYYILQKIEKVKELLSYEEGSLKEIAYRLNYSSAAHLSTQFKKETGLSPRQFKNIKTQKRRQIESI